MNIKQIITMLAVATVAMQARAQKNYFTIQGGYNLPIASQVVAQSTTILDRSNSGGNSSRITTTENIYGSNAQGVNFVMGFGRQFNSNITAELSVSYTMGKKIHFFYKQINQPGLEYTNNYTNKSTYYGINPSIKVHTANTKFNVYAKTGFLVPIAAKTNSVSYKLGVGITGGFGIKYALNAKLSIIAETNAQLLSLKTNKYKTGNTEHIAVDTYTYDYQTPTNSFLATKEPFHALGLQAGLQINF